MSTNLGQIIKEARKAAGLTQVELVERVGLTQSSLSQIEAGQVTPTRSTLILLSRELNSDFDIKWLREDASSNSEFGSKSKEYTQRKAARLASDVSAVIARTEPGYVKRDKLTPTEAMALIRDLLLAYDPEIIERNTAEGKLRTSKHG